MKKKETIELPLYNTWSCEDWISFHERLKRKYGQKEANKVWSEFFDNKPVGWAKDSVCSANDDFIKYFKRQGIKFNANLYTIASDGGKIITFVTNNIYWILGGVLVGAAGIVYLKFYLRKKAAQIV